jgi:excisionase family DNA binding protein
MQLEPILSVETAAQLLQCQPGTVEDLCRAGTLPGHKFGTGWVLPTAAFLHRVNEIALEKSAERRMLPQPAAVQMPRPEKRRPPTLVAVPPVDRRAEQERRYLESSCTDPSCSLCSTPVYARKPGQRHAGISPFAREPVADPGTA